MRIAVTASPADLFCPGAKISRALAPTMERSRPEDCSPVVEALLLGSPLADGQVSTGPFWLLVEGQRP